jgi:NitT/TauT family transport system substrate-binding protein
MPKSQPPAAATPTPPPAELEIGYSALRISLPVLVAEARGLFRAHGLTVKLKRYETAQPLVEEVLDGRIVAGGYAALPIVFTAAARSHAQVRLATAMIEDAAHPVSYLLKKRGNAAIQKVADLRNKRVGVLPTLAYQKWLAAITAHAHLTPSDITVIPLAPPQQASSLAEGVVDALFTNDPMATTAIATGIAESFGPGAPLVDVTGQPTWFGSFMLQPRFVQEQPAQAAALVAALDEAIAFITSDQAAARQLFVPFAREAERPHVDRYPPASYLRSAELSDARLTQELATETKLGILDTTVDAKGVLLSAGPSAP